MEQVCLSILAPAQLLPHPLTEESIASLAAVGEPLILETRISAAAVSTALRVSQKKALLAEQVIRGANPQWDVSFANEPEIPPTAWTAVAFFSRPTGFDWAPLPELSAFPTDPLLACIEALKPQDSSEHAVLRLLIAPASSKRRERASVDLTVPIGPTNPVELVTSFFDPLPREARFEQRVLQTALENRLTHVLFEVAGAITIAGNNRQRLAAQANALDAVIANRFHTAEFSGIRLSPWHWIRDEQSDQDVAAVTKQTLLLSHKELAVWWHPFSAASGVLGARYAKSHHLIFPQQLLSAKGPIIGTTQQRGITLPIPIPDSSFAYGVTIILGPSGYGKSVLAENIIYGLLLE